MSGASKSGSAPTPYDSSTVDLDDDRYEVKQPAIRSLVSTPHPALLHIHVCSGDVFSG